MKGMDKYSCDRSYLETAIENKQRVIAFENDCVRDANTILNGFEQELINMINSFVQSRGRNEFCLADKQDREAFIKAMKEITKRMQEALLEKQVESNIQAYELAVSDQFDLLQSYLESAAELKAKGIEVVYAGEQQSSGDNGMKKPRATVDKTRSRVKKTIDGRIGEAISQFEEEFIELFDASTNSRKTTTSSVEMINRMRRSLESSVRRATEYSMRSSIQSTEEEAYEDIWYENEVYRPTEFQRVEILDGHVCLECMFVDTTYNDKPLGLLHYNCRGMDIPIYYDKNGRRINVDGQRYSQRRLSFDDRFNRLSQKEQRRMLGKGKYELYQSGKLKPSEFISFGSQITLGEAERHVALKSIRQYIKTPEAAIRVNNMLEAGFPSITRMNREQLRAYENILGEQRKVFSFVPKKNFPKDHSYMDYISELDEKYELVQLRYKQLERR